MKVETNNLVKFSTYAKKKGIDRVRLYQMSEKIGNKLNVVIIDGVKFIKVK